MNMNWKTVKVLGSFIIIAGIIFGLVYSILPQNYSGMDLNFEVKSGTVIATNPSEQSIPVAFTGTGVRSFRISSNIDDVSGNSSREGSGSNATQSFELLLPPGTSEFTIFRGSHVAFVASSPVELDVTVNAMTSDSLRTVSLMAVVVICGILFYASNAVDHSWIYIFLNKPVPEPVPDIDTNSQGEAARSFGDNRAHSGD